MKFPFIISSAFKKKIDLKSKAGLNEIGAEFKTKPLTSYLFFFFHKSAPMFHSISILNNLLKQNLTKFSLISDGKLGFLISLFFFLKLEFFLISKFKEIIFFFFKKSSKFFLSITFLTPSVDIPQY
jgi:hypothetical protein